MFRAAAAAGVQPKSGNKATATAYQHHGTPFPDRKLHMVQTTALHFDLSHVQLFQLNAFCCLPP